MTSPNPKPPNSRIYGRLFPVAALVFFSFVATLNLSSSGSWPDSHDGLRYLYLQDQFVESITHGNLYPRFLPNACGGYGYPTFVFYPPGFFWLATPITWLSGSVVWGTYSAVVATFFIGSSGAYRLSKFAGAAMVPALFCAFLYVTTPYLYLNLYVRGDLAELLAVAILPWPIYFVLSPPAFSRRVLLALSLACVIYAHPLTAMFFVPILMWIVLIRTSESWSMKLGDFFSVLSGVTLASPYWLPVLLLEHHVTSEAAFEDYHQVKNHFVCWWQFFSSTWDFGYSVVGSDDGMSFQLGLPHAVLVLVALMLPVPKCRVMWSVFGFYCLFAFMMTSVSIGVWNALPMISKAQFPWRLLGPAAVCQLFIFRQLSAWLSKQPVKYQLALISVASMNLIAWYWPMFFSNTKQYNHADDIVFEHRLSRFEALHTYALKDEFTPVTARRILKGQPIGNRAIIECRDTCRIIVDNSTSRYETDVLIDVSEPSTVLINQLYFPGWRVTVDGEEIPDGKLSESLTDDGRMQISLEEVGAIRIYARYVTPRGQTIGLCFAVAAFVVLMIAQKHCGTRVDKENNL